jgi:hypothetical protein
VQAMRRAYSRFVLTHSRLVVFRFHKDCPFLG